MKKKIKDLELWDIYYFHRRKVVCVGLRFYTDLEKISLAFNHWDYDLEKKVTVIGKMKPEMN